TNSTLTTLNLEENGIGPNGAVALSEALKTNSTLTTLNLWHNWIEPNGPAALSEALKTNSTVTIWGVEFQKGTDATAFSICALIGGFFHLRFINLAIVTPQVYMLAGGLSSEHPRRTLTLFSRFLQNLANKPSYAKEA
ncbi:glyceraldehyde-3-phosphate dehydrogenase 1, partial [Linnemannia elongata]